MTNKEFTDEEITKAVECCSDPCVICDECPLYCVGANCSSFELHRYALDLINRQKAEIERLKECPKCVYEYDDEVMEYCVQGPCPNFKTVEQIKAEAYKEFAERLKNKWFDERYYSPDVDFDDFIDTLLKEMVGEEE